MSRLGAYPVAIGPLAQHKQQQFLANHWSQVQIDTPAESAAREAQQAQQPAPEFTVSPILHLRGERYEIIAWLPGEHSPEASWWEELDLWVLLRRVELRCAAAADFRALKPIA